MSRRGPCRLAFDVDDGKDLLKRIERQNPIDCASTAMAVMVSVNTVVDPRSTASVVLGLRYVCDHVHVTWRVQSPTPTGGREGFLEVNRRLCRRCRVLPGITAHNRIDSDSIW